MLLEVGMETLLEQFLNGDARKLAPTPSRPVLMTKKDNNIQ